VVAPRHFLESDGQIGPLDAIAPIAELDIAGRDFERSGCEVDPFLTTVRAVATSALPCAIIEREPTVPPPMSFGPCGSLARSSTVSAATPNSFATSSGNTVSCPCPEGPESTKSDGCPTRRT